MAVATDNALIKTSTTNTLFLFEVGKLNVTIITKKSGNDASEPPKAIMIASPTDAGVYPVIVLIHGFFLQNHYYTQLVRYISSHGFIVVVPEVQLIAFFTCIMVVSLTLSEVCLLAIVCLTKIIYSGLNYHIIT